MDTRQAQELLQKYLDGKCSPEEKAIFESWYNQSIQDRPDPIGDPDYEALHQRLAEALPAGIKRRKTLLWPRIAAAASIVIALSAGIYFYTSRNEYGGEVGGRHPELVSGSQDIAPGKNTATITLANGSTIVLSDAKSGVVVKDKKVVYNDNTEARHPELVSGPRIIQTPRGGTYQITLPDGTKVWLNAASSLKFPSTFNRLGNRKVELSGEAYFEVAKDMAHPFIVQTDKQEVEVLGTHFNINSYAEETVTKTTLLEGSVKVTAKTQTKILKPGQQAVLSESEILLKNVEVGDAIDWKQGYFMFNNETLESGMTRIARWYNVQIVYEDERLKAEPFFGRISKFENISKVLSMLERTDVVRFRIDGDKIIVGRKK